MQSLERKYLLGEMISNYGSFQLELFIQILRSSLKSMTQEVSKVQIEKKEYQELIEKWAHELKAPIASITLVCENNPSELSRKILLQANRLSYNVEQVLYYARLGYMSNDYMIKRVSLEDIIHTAILNNKQLLIQNQFSIEVHTVDSFVYTDTKALVFILGQIINNSAQYRSSSPLLTFRAIDTNHHVYLEIQDNGTGIRESDLGRVFEKGFTGSNGHQRKTSTGIGLYALSFPLHRGAVLLRHRSAPLWPAPAAARQSVPPAFVHLGRPIRSPFLQCLPTYPRLFPQYPPHRNMLRPSRQQPAFPRPAPPLWLAATPLSPRPWEHGRHPLFSAFLQPASV